MSAQLDLPGTEGPRVLVLECHECGHARQVGAWSCLRELGAWWCLDYWPLCVGCLPHVRARIERQDPSGRAPVVCAELREVA